jgi:hypothetical protein
MKFDASDPRWSAYVLYELDATDAALAEKELQSSPEAREAVDALRATAAVLGVALDRLPRLELSLDQRRAIEAAPREEAGIDSKPPGPNRVTPGGWPAWRRPLLLVGTTAAALIVTVAAAVASRWLPGQAAPQPPEMRLEVGTPPTNTPSSLAVSPDGLAIAYVAMTRPFETTPAGSVATGNSELWIRRLTAVSPRLLTKGNLTAFPFWSPDGRSLGFFADGKLKRIDLDGGPAVVLADAQGSHGGSWGSDGTILFARSHESPIERIPAAGGVPTAVTQLASPQQRGHAFPQLLPDGDHFLYYVRGTQEERGVYVGRLSRSDTRRLLEADAGAVYASGRLFFVRQQTLLAQDFDPVRLSLTGRPHLVAEDVIVEPLTARFGASAAVSVSPAGPIVFRASPSAQARLASAEAVALSPDGRYIAYQSTDSGRTDIWVRPSSGADRQVTTGGGREPVWRADGSEIFFTDANGQLMSVKVEADSKRDGIAFGKPAPLLPVRIQDRVVVFARDGRQIPLSYGPIVVLLNWKPRP